ncbi:serine/threonine kinase [Aureococcus anophagefferens]|nr:serine/threonine kinase [Aureococcus anophagefferens]
MVLTACGAFEMHVMLGESKAEEFAPVAGCAPCDGFIEANLFVKGVSYQKEEVETDPFGETFTQAWPVTPYKRDARSSASSRTPDE